MISAKNTMLDLGCDPDHESDIYSCLNVLCEIVEDQGVPLFEKEEACALGKAAFEKKLKSFLFMKLKRKRAESELNFIKRNLFSL